MSESLTVGSLFAGIGAFDLGFHRAGMRTAWMVEIDPHCRRVLSHHWPDVQLHEDVRQCGKCNLSRVDVITGGFPCQDLSVAGKRAGLVGQRSGLFYEMTRIVDELRPALLVWENVPGLLSNRSGRDFLAVLIELDRIGYSGAWTCLDAQWFGVAQRRRRIFGVFARGDIGAARCAEILALRTRRKGHPAPGQEARADVAACIRGRSHGPGVNEPGRGGEDDHNLIAFDKYNQSDTGDVAHSICAGVDGYNNPHLPHVCVAHTLRPEGCDASEDGTGRGTPLVVQSNGSDIQVSDRPGALMGEPTAGGPIIAFAQNQRNEVRDLNGLAGALANQPGFAANQGGTVIGFHATQNPISGNVAPAMGCGNKQGGGTVGVASGMMVRRLTPVECCRLQGFPDEWLDLDPPLSDSVKYRLLGNACAVPVCLWLGRRIVHDPH